MAFSYLLEIQSESSCEREMLASFYFPYYSNSAISDATYSTTKPSDESAWSANNGSSQKLWQYTHYEIL